MWSFDPVGAETYSNTLCSILFHMTMKTAWKSVSGCQKLFGHTSRWVWGQKGRLEKCQCTKQSANAFSFLASADAAHTGYNDKCHWCRVILRCYQDAFIVTPCWPVLILGWCPCWFRVGSAPPAREPLKRKITKSLHLLLSLPSHSCLCGSVAPAFGSLHWHLHTICPTHRRGLLWSLYTWLCSIHFISHFSGNQIKNTLILILFTMTQAVLYQQRLGATLEAVFLDKTQSFSCRNTKNRFKTKPFLFDMVT